MSSLSSLVEVTPRIVRAGRPTWTLTYRARPWTVNTERGRAGKKAKDSEWHWSTRAEAVKEWREAFYILAKEAKVPRLATAGFDVLQITPTKVRPDPGSIYPAIKAAIDGLVDAKVLPDDGPEYVEWVTFWPAEKGANGDKVLLTITGKLLTPS